MSFYRKCWPYTGGKMIPLRPNFTGLSSTALWTLTLLLTLSAGRCDQHGVGPLGMIRGEAEEVGSGKVEEVKKVGGRKRLRTKKKSSEITQGTGPEESDDTTSSVPPPTPPPSPPRKREATPPSRGRRIKRTRRASREKEKKSNTQLKKQLEDLLKAAEEDKRKGVTETRTLGIKLFKIAKLQPGENCQDRVRAIAAYPNEKNPAVLAHVLLEAVQRSLSNTQSLSAQELVYLAQLSKFQAQEKGKLKERFKNIFRAVFRQVATLKAKAPATEEIFSTLQDAFKKAYEENLVEAWYDELLKGAKQRKKRRGRSKRQSKSSTSK